MTLSFDTVRDTPLESDAELVEHLGLLLEGAMRRQVWLLFLDSQARPLPVLYPSYLSQKPRKRDTEALGHFIQTLRDELDADAVVVTYERRGRPTLSEADRAWLRCLRDACLESTVPFRGPFLLHTAGAEQVAPDDYVA